MTFYTINTCRSFFPYIRAAGGLLSYIASRHFSSPHVSYILPVTFFFLQPPGYSIYIEPSIESMPFYVDWSFSFFFFLSLTFNVNMLARLFLTIVFSSFISIHSVFFYFLNAFDLPYIFGCWCCALSDVIYTCCWLPASSSSRFDCHALGLLAGCSRFYIIRRGCSDRSDGGGWQTTHRSATRTQRDCSLHIHQG